MLQNFTSIRIFIFNYVSYGQDESNLFKYFEEFDAMLNSIPNIHEYLVINHDYVADIYASIGKYFYRNGELKKALKISEKGLRFYPSNKKIKSTIR